MNGDPWADVPGQDPVGRASLEVCQGSSCREVGGVELLAELERLSGLRSGCVANDGSLSLHAGFCQGRCAIGPNVRVNGVSVCVPGPSAAGELLLRALDEPT